MDLTRQAMIIKGDPAIWSMLVIGAGGIGSNVVYNAACLGFQDITVYEPDIVGPENPAPQFYPLYDADGRLKTDSLSQTIKDWTGVEIKAIPEPFERQGGKYDIVVVAVDSIAIRRRIWKLGGLDWKFWIDGRMGGKQAEIYAVPNTPEGRAFYEESMQGNMEPLACGMKATAFITKGIIPGLVGSILAKIVDQEPFPQLVIDDAHNIYQVAVWPRVDGYWGEFIPEVTNETV